MHMHMYLSSHPAPPPLKHSITALKHSIRRSVCKRSAPAMLHVVRPSRLAAILLIPAITGLALAVRLVARRRTLTVRQAADESPSKPTPPVAGWHRRPLPPPAIALSSADGRTLAKAALSLGSMETFFALAEVFETQSEPAFCGLGTLVTALNALEVDPGELWKGPWRWYDAKMLDCCVDLDEIAERGLTFDEWVCLAKCQGLAVEATRASESSEQIFRQLVARECASAAGRILCVSYSRRPLGQTGDGHFSPVGGYHAVSDSVLVLDVARFKHPPHWLPLPLLWQAMLLQDGTTKRARGYATLARVTPPVSGGMGGSAVGSAIVSGRHLLLLRTSWDLQVCTSADPAFPLALPGTHLWSEPPRRRRELRARTATKDGSRLDHRRRGAVVRRARSSRPDGLARQPSGRLLSPSGPGRACRDARGGGARGSAAERPATPAGARHFPVRQARRAAPAAHRGLRGAPSRAGRCGGRTPTLPLTTGPDLSLT